MNPERETLRDQVRATYDTIAEAPADDHPFRVGREVAERAGYLPEGLAGVPAETVEAFAGISCLPCFAEIGNQDRVLDLGCGAGLDSILAARQAASVIGLDFSPAMLDRARKSAAAVAVANAEFRLGDAESIPLENDSIDVALVNGIFNLNQSRGRIFEELARVIRPGGLVFAAELVLKGPRPSTIGLDEDDWFA
ncbi:MAG: hypothetical protein NVS9B1_21220 [Candidatus Dormibacteraceae bacterium]